MKWCTEQVDWRREFDEGGLHASQGFPDMPFNANASESGRFEMHLYVAVYLCEYGNFSTASQSNK